MKKFKYIILMIVILIASFGFFSYLASKAGQIKSSVPHVYVKKSEPMEIVIAPKEKTIIVKHHAGAKQFPTIQIRPIPYPVKTKKTDVTKNRVNMESWCQGAYDAVRGTNFGSCELKERTEIQSPGDSGSSTGSSGDGGSSGSSGSSGCR